MLVAGRSVNVTRDGKLVSLSPGDPVPEAAAWPHDVLLRCMKVGQIVNVERASPEAVAEAAAQTEAQLKQRTVAAAKNAGQAPALPEQPKPTSTSRMPKEPPKKSTSKMPKKTAA